MHSRALTQKLLLILLFSLCSYLVVGLGFHLKWKSELAACWQARASSGELPDSEVFSWPLALVFDVTWWPVYAWANTYHFGDPFATPCTRMESYPQKCDQECF